MNIIDQTGLNNQDELNPFFVEAMCESTLDAVVGQESRFHEVFMYGDRNLDYSYCAV